VGLLAVGALVVVEVDDDDIAVRVAADRAVGVAEQFGLVLLDAFLRRGALLAVLGSIVPTASSAPAPRRPAQMSKRTERMVMISRSYRPLPGRVLI
jgi:hypothetical protein